jgi:hypothetical protein
MTRLNVRLQHSYCFLITGKLMLFLRRGNKMFKRKKTFWIGAVGFDIRVLETRWFREAIKAAKDSIGEKVKVRVVKSHSLNCDAVLMTARRRDMAPNGIPAKAVDIDNCLPNEAAKVIYDAICELHDSVVLNRLDVSQR